MFFLTAGLLPHGGTTLEQARAAQGSLLPVSAYLGAGSHLGLAPEPSPVREPAGLARRASGGGQPRWLPRASGVCGSGWGSAARHDVAALCLWLDTVNGFFPLFRIKLAGSKPLAKPALLQLLLQAREWVLEGIWSPSIHVRAQILEKCFSSVTPIKQ